MNGFDFSAFDAVDTSDLHITNPQTGEQTGWTITFAGPAHPQTLSLSDRATRERLREDRQREMAVTNGKKWKAPERTPDDLRSEAVASVADRITGWSPDPVFDGAVVTYSRDNTIKLLSDPKRGWLFQQCLDFLVAEASFTKRSPKD